MRSTIIDSLTERLLDEKWAITIDEACELSALGTEHLFDLLSLSRSVAAKHREKGVYLCSIISAKTGACPEDCAFCAQSAHYPPSPRDAHPMLEPTSVLEAARVAEKSGATEFCIVTGGRGPDKGTMGKVLDAVRLIRAHTGLSVGCSLGILTEEQAELLSTAGVNRYNHNLEASRTFFPNVCTTHGYDDRVRTARLVKEKGMELCCGGILGLGESVRQRVELAFELRKLNPSLVPLNFLNPRPNTPFAERPPLSPLEALRWVALFRVILPESVLICAGGREAVFGELQPLALLAGANAVIAGNYLTTRGQRASEDLDMIRSLGLPILSHSAQ